MIMNWNDQKDITIYKVVVNHEQQYFILPTDRENPFGWKDAGKIGLKPQCLECIKPVLTDLKPLSFLMNMAETTGNKTA